MSSAYAQMLSYTEEVGAVGLPEMFDYPHVLKSKISQLAEMIKQSKHLVVLTGAGISTSCGIPDFRGSNGVWTLQSQGIDVPEPVVPFHRVTPSVTHMALVQLERAGIVKCVVSQNFDNLHLRSGIPREKLAEVHGNAFREECPTCGAEYLRDFEIGTVGGKSTPRRCDNNDCTKKLRDTVVDWQCALPRKEKILAEEQCRLADVVLCLGTSLQITPASNIPLKCLPGGGKIVIVNLQATPKDNHASLIIRGHVDKVIAGLMHHLDLQIPPYVRVDLVQVTLSQCTPVSSDSKPVQWNLRVGSLVGYKAPIPFVQSVEVSFLDLPKYKQAVLAQHPFKLQRSIVARQPFTLVLKLNLCDGCGVPSTTVHFPVNFLAEPPTIRHDKDDVVQRLTAEAIESGSCGQNSQVERYSVARPRKQVGVFALSTNVVFYDSIIESFNIFEIVPRMINIDLNKEPDEAEGSQTPSKRLRLTWR